MKFYNVCSKKKYVSNSGEDKVEWIPAGTLKVNDEGKMFLKLGHLPDVEFYCFEQKAKEETL